jgi:UDP-N-acetylmuramoylalanine--D-glutamate ligase
MIPLSFMAGLPVAVLGLGRSGLSAARALQRSGAEVLAWDDSAARRAEAEAAGIPLRDLNGIDWREPVSLVLSPGIPHTYPAPHPVAAKAREAGCEIVGDIELLGRAVPDASYIGVTGTNGKSTTTALIGHLLNLSGRDAQVGGNLGPPVLDFTKVEGGGTIVLEMSSYQLERTHSITFDAAVLLNITPDHLDRHGGLDGYIAAKREIFRRQTAPRTAIVGIDDPICRDIYADLRAQGQQAVVPISGETPVAGGVYVRDGVLIDDLDGQAVPALDLREVATLPGRHNWQNAAAAYATARRVGVDAPVAAACLRSFPGLPHRQEIVATHQGVTFVNDSKATNAEAALRALTSYGAIYWIAGGRAKEGGLRGTERGWPNVRRAFLIGEAAEDFGAALSGAVAAEACGDLDTAVAAAFERARAEGAADPVVLLSPACASFDQFASFEARGDAFKAAVAALGAAASRGDRTGGAA